MTEWEKSILYEASRGRREAVIEEILPENARNQSERFWLECKEHCTRHSLQPFASLELAQEYGLRWLNAGRLRHG